MPILTPRARLFVSAGAIALAMALSGCASQPDKETTGSIASPAPRTEADWRRESETLAERYRANPEDGAVALQYSQALRGIGQRSQAVAVLEQASLKNPHDMTIL